MTLKPGPWRSGQRVGRMNDGEAARTERVQLPKDIYITGTENLLRVKFLTRFEKYQL